MQLDRFIWGTLPLWAMVCFSCGGSSSPMGRVVPPASQETGAGGAGSQHGDAGATVSGSGGAPGTGGSGDPLACADLFDQGSLQTYSFDVSADQMAALDVEFHNLTALESGADFAVYHPITFHLNGETVTNAAIKLHGQSSWGQTVMLDGDRAKMQFDVSFDQVDPMGAFHGVSKLVFDMPRDDWTFMHDRVSQAWLRQTGIMAPCSSSARLDINGSYYGLYVLEQGVGNGTVNAFFPANPHGDLWKGGVQAETNTASPNVARLKQFQSATDLVSLSAIVDVPSSLTSWGAEALLNDSDGYYGGDHNFYLYDQGAAGYVFLPQDTDSDLDWLATFDLPGATDHPVYWWSSRAQPSPTPGDKWLIVLGDAAQRVHYADAIEALLPKWNVTQIQGWIDSWSQQIAASAASDPHAWATPAETQQATQTARDIVAKRPAYLQTFVDCEHGVPGAATDADGDGYNWCDECDDSNPKVHPGAKEICGNGIDDDCNGFVDDGC
jgi:Putative metal-binding motif/CotH kinase protein